MSPLLTNPRPPEQVSRQPRSQGSPTWNKLHHAQLPKQSLVNKLSDTKLGVCYGELYCRAIHYITVLYCTKVKGVFNFYVCR